MIIVRTIPELRDLVGNKRVTSLFARQTVLLDIPGLDKRERDGWQARLNAYQHDCGCSIGAAFLLTSAPIVLSFDLLRASALSLGAIGHAVVVAIIASLLLGFVGKLIGLYSAKVRFRRTCTRLLHRLSRPTYPNKAL